MENALAALLNDKGVLLADGATGSNLFEVGLQTGDSPELWNDIHPDRIANQYQSFIDAGSDIILTNTFGGNRYRLKLHDAADRVEELNIKAARLARQQADRAGRTVLVGGSMGPTGEILQPLGPLSIEEAADAFAEQARALQEGGADILWIETMSSREEVEAAVIGASQAGLPVVTTFSVDTNGRTMMGLAPADIVDVTRGLQNQPYAIGANCGVGASESIAAIVNMKTACRQHGIDPVIIVKANCGVPEYIDGKIVYSGTREIMAEYAGFAIDAGARIIGGCCGTTPAHVAAMRKAIDEHTAGDAPGLEVIIERLGDVSSGARAQLRGEMSVAAGAVSDRGEGRPRRRRRG
jgi:5-methyltetrahydrofolate--homocysteine methyltransferase